MKFNEQRLRFVLTSPAGPVGRFLNRSGALVQQRARNITTLENHSRSGRFRSSIAYQLDSGAIGLSLKVGSNVPYFRFLEKGADEHPIVPSAKRALWWEQKSNVGDRLWVVPDRPLASVLHPGNPPYRIVGRAIEQVMGRGARRVTG